MKKLQALDCEPKDGVFVVIMRLNFARLPYLLYSSIFFIVRFPSLHTDRRQYKNPFCE